jgi:predicted Zn-dependent protease
MRGAVKRVSILPVPALLLLGCALGATACAINPVTRRPEVVLVSEATEKKLGAQEAQKVAQEMGLSEDPELVAYVNAIGARLAEHSPRKGVEWRFFVVDSDIVNAFALPGGFIYVTRGLLARVNSEDELASVIGHEIGHVAAKHAVQRVTAAAPLAVATGIPAAAVGLVLPRLGRSVGSLGQFANSLALAPYGREQERQSDREGQKMAAAAGWDPSGLSAFMHTLEREEELRGEDGPPWFLRTHPTSNERMSETKAFAATLTPAQPNPIAADRSAFLARLDGLLVGANPAEGVFREERFLHPDMGLFLAFPRHWKTQNARDFVAAWTAEGDARIVLQLAGEGDDALGVARAFAQREGAAFGLLPKAVQLGANQGARAYGRYGDATLDVSWVAFGGMVYQLTGICGNDDYERFQTSFIDVALSLRTLRADERGSVEVDRLRIVEARRGERLDALVERVGGRWDAKQTAVANGLEVSRPLSGGTRVKVPIAEAYRPTSGSASSAGGSGAVR